MKCTFCKNRSIMSLTIEDENGEPMELCFCGNHLEEYVEIEDTE